MESIQEKIYYKLQPQVNLTLILQLHSGYLGHSRSIVLIPDFINIFEKQGSISEVIFN